MEIECTFFKQCFTSKINTFKQGPILQVKNGVVQLISIPWSEATMCIFTLPYTMNNVKDFQIRLPIQLCQFIFNCPSHATIILNYTQSYLSCLVNHPLVAMEYSISNIKCQKKSFNIPTSSQDVTGIINTEIWKSIINTLPEKGQCEIKCLNGKKNIYMQNGYWNVIVKSSVPLNCTDKRCVSVSARELKNISTFLPNNWEMSIVWTNAGVFKMIGNNITIYIAPI